MQVKNATAAADQLVEVEADCRICLDNEVTADTGPLLSAVCACRGAMRAVHQRCLVRGAEAAEARGFADSWYCCGLCHQQYVGPAELILARADFVRYKDTDPSDEDFLAAASNMASALCCNAATLLKENPACEQGREELRQAEELYRKVSNTRRTVLGATHIDTLNDMSNLAATLDRQQHKREEAESLYRQVLESHQESDNADQQDVLNTTVNLGICLSHQGKYAEAEKLHRSVVPRSIEILGSDHADTLNNMVGLARACVGQAKHVEALRLLREAYEIQKRVLGPDHPDLNCTRHELARAQQGLEEAVVSTDSGKRKRGH